MKKYFGLWIFCFAFFPAMVFAADIDSEIDAHYEKIADHDLNVKKPVSRNKKKQSIGLLVVEYRMRFV